MRTIFIFFLLATTLATAQVMDNFNDGNFTPVLFGVVMMPILL